MEQHHRWGLRSTLPLFIKSFLNDRKFVVRINAEKSTELTLENDVSQGYTIQAVLYENSLTVLHSHLSSPD